MSFMIIVFWLNWWISSFYSTWSSCWVNILDSFRRVFKISEVMLNSLLYFSSFLSLFFATTPLLLDSKSQGWEIFKLKLIFETQTHFWKLKLKFIYVKDNKLELKPKLKLIHFKDKNSNSFISKTKNSNSFNSKTNSHSNSMSL